MSASPSRSRSPTVSDTACWTCDTSLVTRDISCPVDAPAEERRRLIEDVPEELIAQIAHDPLADVGHQVAGEVRAEPFGQIGEQNRRPHQMTGGRARPGKTPRR